MSNPFLKRAAPATIPAEETELKTAVRVAIAANDSADSILDQATPAMADSIDLSDMDMDEYADSKLSQLISDDFPFDESQLAAVNGMIRYDAACLTGAAGTGKTTVTKKLIDSLLKQLPSKAVDLKAYFTKGDAANPEDPDDDYEIVKQYVPSVCAVSFTGRATQMIKKNFPRDWHGNIMTIHRALGFMPEWYDDVDPESMLIKKKMRFVPSYTADFQLPWDIILIDEAGMLGLDLWKQLWAAMKPGCRVYFIGDINQLPPVHGRSVFGFALAKLPSWELTEIHRQKGKHNAIVDNAWRVINGQMPVSEGNFAMIELRGDATYASRQVRAIVPKLKEQGIYEPNRDTIITPINGEEGSRGYALGQLPLNRQFSTTFNPNEETPRFIIDAGRVKQRFAVGDKVMATKNDHEAGITNGMTGIITAIEDNAAYAGDRNRFGKLDDVNAFFAEDESAVENDFELHDLDAMMEEIGKRMDDAKEKAERGPASHVVTVRFGEEEHGREMAFSTLSEVSSLMTAYVVTCHKMQGGESPTIIIICHDAHKAMMYSEWLYTAITRASARCILLYSKDALRAAISKRKIKGKNLKEKIETFNRLIVGNGIVGPSVTVPLPEIDYDDSDSVITGLPAVASGLPAGIQLRPSFVAKQAAQIKPDSASVGQQANAPQAEPAKVVVEHVHTHRVIITEIHEAARSPSQEQPSVVDGGELHPTPIKPRLIPQLGAIRTMLANEDQQAIRLLTYSPTPIALPAPTKPKHKNPFAALGLKEITK